jgi:hypothetical protein
VVGVALYVLPWLVFLHRADRLQVSVANFWITAGLLVLIAAMGGVLALVPNQIASRGQAIEYGLGSQAVLKGIVSSLREALSG